MNQISNINIAASLPSIADPTSLGQPPEIGVRGSEFKKLLLEGLDQVNQMQVDADQAVQQLFTGGEADPAEVLTAVQKADMAFRMMIQIRNKLVDAYQEIQNIRI